MPPPPTMEESSTAFSVKSASTAGTLPTFKRAISTSYPRQTYYELARAMKEEIKVKDRKFHLRTYKQCFLGSDAVGFIQTYLELEDRQEALEVGRELNDRIHCWEHVCGDHHLKDEKLFFRFTDSSKSQQGCLEQVLKSRRVERETNNSLIEDSDTEASDEEDANKPNMGDMYNQLVKGVGEALTQQPPDNNIAKAEIKEADAAPPTRISRTRKPRSRPNSHSPKRGEPSSSSRNREREANSSRSRERKETTTPREGGSKSPKPSQTRVPRRPRAERRVERRGRSKSPVNGGSSSSNGASSASGPQTIQRSNTFHGRGSREARKQLHHVERPAGNKRINALKNKTSRSPIRRKGSDMSNAPSVGSNASSVGSTNTNTEEQEESLENEKPAFEFPQPLGVVPLTPLPSRRTSRSRSPNGRAAALHTESLLTALSPVVKKEEDKDFLQRGYASWGPDSEEFKMWAADNSEKEELHQSMSAVPTSMLPKTLEKSGKKSEKKKGMRKSISIDGMTMSKPPTVQKSTSNESSSRNAAFPRSKTTEPKPEKTSKSDATNDSNTNIAAFRRSKTMEQPTAKPEKEKTKSTTKVIKAMFKRSKTTTEAKSKDMPKSLLEKPTKMETRSASTGSHGSMTRSLSSDALAKPAMVQKSRSDATALRRNRFRMSLDMTKGYMEVDDQPKPRSSAGSMGSIHDDARVIVKRSTSTDAHGSSTGMTKSSSSDNIAKPSRVKQTKSDASAAGMKKSSSSDNIAKPSRVKQTKSDASAGSNAAFRRSKTTGAEAPGAKFRSSLEKKSTKSFDESGGPENVRPASRSRKSKESRSKSFDGDGLDGRGSNHGNKSSKSRISAEAKSRSALEKKAGGDTRGTKSRSFDGPESSSKSPKTSRSRISVEAKFRSSLEKKKARSGLDKGSNHSLSSNKRGSNHSLSSLGKGSNHSLASGGSRTGLLVALYGESKKNDDESVGSNNAAAEAENLKDAEEEEQGISLEEVAFAEKRTSVGNESVTSALNSSMLGELSDDEDFDSKEFG